MEKGQHSDVAIPQVVEASVGRINRNRLRLYGPRAFLMGSVALISVLVAIRVWVCWTKDAYVTFPAGALLTMAMDLKDGVFYRPLFGPWGYGGTRYFPLYFVLDAFLLKLHVPVLLSAYLLSGAAVILLLIGCFHLMKALGVEPWLAACAAGAILAPTCCQLSLTYPHADGLASALNVWGLAVIVRPKPRRKQIVLASILFTLAWSAKMTTVFGFAVALVWLVSKGSRRTAWELAVATCSGYLLVAGAMMLASQGRVLDIFEALSSGGATWRSIASGPLGLLDRVVSERGLLVFLILALLALFQFAWSRELVRSLPALLFLAAIVVTTIIFGSPGTVRNHLLDVQIAAVILFTVWLANRRTLAQRRLGTYALALAVLLAAVPLWHRLQWDSQIHPHFFQHVIALVDTHKPLLTENALIAVLAGQHPYVIDPQQLPLLEQRIPGFLQPLLDRLRSQAFGAIVLDRDPRTERCRALYETVYFGPGFTLALMSNYRLAFTVDDTWIWLPRSQIPEEITPPIDSYHSRSSHIVNSSPLH